MDTLWTAIKMGFAGIANPFTLFWLVVGTFVYGIGCVIVSSCEDKAFLMGILGDLQLRLGQVNVRWVRRIARWLWVKMFDLDYQRRCEFLTSSTVDQKQASIASCGTPQKPHKLSPAQDVPLKGEGDLSLALRLFSQVEPADKKAKTLATMFVRSLAASQSVTGNLANMAKVVLKELEVVDKSTKVPNPKSGS